MLHAELATRLVEAANGEREALLRQNTALAGVKLAYALKEICYDAWTDEPARALQAAAALRALADQNSDPEISAVADWASAIAAIVDGQMEKAISHLDAARSRFLSLRMEHEAAATQVGKLIALSMLGRYDEALSLGLGAREVFLRYGDVLAAGKIEHNIGNLYFRRDRYHDAEQFQSAARERFISLDDQKQLATINNCLANTRALLHKFKSAEELYQQAMEQAQTSGLPVTLAEIEGNIGNFALLQGKYDRALDYLERSRRRYAALGMMPRSLSAEHEIADAYLELNLAPEAAAIYERVIPRFADLRLRADEARARAYYGRALGLLGRISEAQKSLSEARELYATERNDVGAAAVALAHAQLHYKMGDYASASKTAAEAQPVFLTSGSWQRLLIARWLQGEAERSAGNIKQARTLLKQTLAEAELKAQPQVSERCYTSLGMLASMSGNAAAAERYFRAAIVLTEELRAPLPGEEFRTAFFSDKLLPYNEMVRICLSDRRVNESLAFVEAGRSRALADMLRGNLRWPIKARDAFEADLLQQLEGLRGELNYLYNELNHPGSTAADPNQIAKTAELQHDIREREGQLLSITRRLQHRSEHSSIHANPFDIKDLQTRLGTDTALVEYTTIDEELVAFVATNERVEVVRNLGIESEIAEAIAQFRFQIDAFRYGSEAIRRHLPALTERVRRHLVRMYDWLLRPIEPLIGARRVAVVPYRTLHYIPFQALYDGTNYVIEKREISYAPSATVLSECLSLPARAFSSSLLVGVADEQIPRVRDEIAAISKVFPKPECLLDENATTEAFRQHSSSTDVLHLACHAQFRWDNPLFSSLRLADGWLTVRDAYDLQLNSGLVTLSACETGVNTIAPGDELIGLARGFLSAGSRSVLISLWTVDDDATAVFMADFYRNLIAVSSPAAALRAAQTKLLKEFSHPFFWSPFVLVGRW